MNGYFLYSYQALNGIGSGALVCFEPYRFNSESSAKKYAAILKVLKHNEFFVMSEQDVRDNFNLIQDEVSFCDS